MNRGVFFMRNITTKNKPDIYLLFFVILLVGIGLMMIYSASHIWATDKFADPFYFVKRQGLFAVLGIALMFFVMQIHYLQWKKYVYIILFLSYLLLILVLIPGIGIVRGGAQSWIGIGIFSIQPAEFSKLALIIFLSTFLTSKNTEITSLKKGFIPSLFILFSTFGFIMLQPDLGTGIVLVLTCMLLIFIAGAKISHFLSLAAMGGIAFVGLILSAPYRISRITAFLNPWEDPLGDGFQIIQSLYAIGPGGLLGVGFKNSLQKYFYLPEPQTDFIFSIFAEEYGFIGGVGLLILFILVLWRGIYIALKAPDAFSRLLAFGIVGMITIQVMINISVVIGLIPVTGITLPLLSYGGSSLVLCLFSIGILLNISKFTKDY